MTPHTNVVLPTRVPSTCICTLRIHRPRRALYLETTFTAAVAKSSQHIGGGKIKDTLQPRGVSVGEGIDAIKRKPNLRKKSIISE